MRMSIYLCIPIIFLLGCQQQNTTNHLNELDSTIKAIAKKYQVTLTFKIFLSKEESNPLVLITDDHITYTATLGLIVKDCYQQLEKKGIQFDRFIIQNSKGDIGIDISQVHLNQVLNCQINIRHLTDELMNGHFESLEEHLDTTVFKPEQIEMVKVQAMERLQGNVTEIGFEIQQENNQTYCMYEFIMDTTFVSVTVNLDKKNCKICGLQF